MLFLTAMFLLTDPARGVLVQTPHYTRVVSGEPLQCAQCPPGTHMESHCTATTATKCAPCRTDHFTEFWNYLPKCLYCNVFCRDNQEVETECSPLRNRVCRCKEGYYSASDFCLKHSKCGPGQGVQTRGTSRSDTVCKMCPDDSFSYIYSALDSCVKLQKCASTGQMVLLRGSRFHDTVCGSCEDLRNGGRVKVLRTFLPGFFSLHRMRASKMKKFVRHLQKAGVGSSTSLPSQGGALLRQIIAWIAEAPEDQLRRLPETLRASQLSSLATRLEKRLGEIQRHAPNCE
ncbi:tumor necrosis factor receptor superfamily member 6B-like [Polymixia lowei]